MLYLPEILLTDKRHPFQGQEASSDGVSTSSKQGKGQDSSADDFRDRLVNESAVRQLKSLERRLLRLGTLIIDGEKASLSVSPFTVVFAWNGLHI